MPATLFQQNRGIKLLAVLPTVFVFAFVVVPVGNILVTSLKFESLKILKSETILNVVWFTTWQATISTVASASLVIALPIAAVIANFKFRSQRLIISLISVPFILPSIVVGAAFLQVLPNSFHRTAFALILAHTYFNFGFAARIIGARWQQIHPHLDDAARTLGASPRQVFTSITLKLLGKVILNSALIVFTLCFTSYGVVRILGVTIETEIYFRAMQLGDVSGALVLSLLQICVISIAFLFISSTRRTNRLQIINTTISRQRLINKTSQKLAISTICLMSIAFALVPILAIFRKSLISNSRLSTNAWREVLSNTRVLNSLITSLGYAVVTILIATTIALLAASSLAYNKNFRFISALTSLPILVSAVSIGLGIIVTFDTQPFNWRGSQMMLPIAHALVALPLAIRAITPVLNDIPDSLRQASSVLGANNWQVWRTIDFKIVRRAIIVAAAISAAVSLGEFGASSFLVRRNSETLPVTISRLLSRPGDILQSQGYALASLLIIFSIIVIFVIDKFSTTESANSRA
ncbi:MAG: hypothetical protein RIT00_949 [Actinomycetota bacterium]